MSTGGAKTTDVTDEDFQSFFLQLASDAPLDFGHDAPLMSQPRIPQDDSIEDPGASSTHTSADSEYVAKAKPNKRSSSQPEKRLGRKPILTPIEDVVNTGAELKKLTAELEKYQSNKDTLIAPLELAKKESSDWLKKEKKRLSAHISRLKKSISDLQERNIKEQLLEDKKTLTAALKKANETPEELKMARSRISDLESEIKGLQSKLELVEGELAQSVSKCEQMEKAQRQEREAHICEKIETKKAMEALLRLNEKDSAKYQEQLTLNKRLERQCTDLEKRDRQAQQDIRRLKDLQARLEEHYEAFKESDAQVIRELEYHNRASLDKIDELTHLLNQVTDERNYQLARANERIRALEDEIALIRRESNPPIVYQQTSQRAQHNPLQSRSYPQNDTPSVPKMSQRNSRN